MDLSKYRAIIFDCDGVILNSNNVKTSAFYKAALPYGEDVANNFAIYNKIHGGVSRFEKFNYLLSNLILQDAIGPTLSELLVYFSDEVREGLLKCDIAQGIHDLRLRTTLAKWYVVSGGEQDELKKVFHKRGLDNYFDGGIYGSPNTKDEILNRLLEEENISFPALFLGDSRYDHEVSTRMDIDFLFISKWTDFNEWEEYCLQNNIKTIPTISGLLT